MVDLDRVVLRKVDARRALLGERGRRAHARGTNALNTASCVFTEFAISGLGATPSSSSASILFNSASVNRSFAGPGSGGSVVGSRDVFGGDLASISARCSKCLNRPVTP